jgi:hypothetical protein
MRMYRSLLVLLGGAGALLAAGVVVALIAVRQPETAYPAHSPQATVATYLRLLQNGQVDTAYPLVQWQPLRSRQCCHMDREQFHQQFEYWGQTPHRVTLLQTGTSGPDASVTVEIAIFSADAFGASDQTCRQTFRLVRQGGAWRITGDSTAYLCGR